MSRACAPLITTRILFIIVWVPAGSRPLLLAPSTPSPSPSLRLLRPLCPPCDATAEAVSRPQGSGTAPFHSLHPLPSLRSSAALPCSMAGAVRVETFPAPLILNLRRSKASEEEKEDGEERAQKREERAPATPLPSPPLPALVSEEDDAVSAFPSPPRAVHHLSLHLSRMEAVEDEEEATIQVEGADAGGAEQTEAASRPAPMRLKLSLAGVDVEDGGRDIDTASSNSAASVSAHSHTSTLVTCTCSALRAPALLLLILLVWLCVLVARTPALHWKVAGS